MKFNNVCIYYYNNVVFGKEMIFDKDVSLKIIFRSF